MRQFLPILLPIALLQGCVAELDGVTTGSTPPAGGIYRCEGGEKIDVTLTGATATIAGAQDGDAVVLPAAPPNQSERFGEGLYALVMSAGEALFMKSGEEPMACVADGSAR